jgi:hypothetical protein
MGMYPSSGPDSHFCYGNRVEKSFLARAPRMTVWRKSRTE